MGHGESKRTRDQSINREPDLPIKGVIKILCDVLIDLLELVDLGLPDLAQLLLLLVELEAEQLLLVEVRVGALAWLSKAYRR